LLIGKDPDIGIHHIKATLPDEGYSFNINVRSEKPIFNYVKLPSNIEDAFPAKLTYYDIKGNNITTSIIQSK